MAEGSVGQDFRKLCQTFNASAWPLRLGAYVIGGVSAHSIGIFAVLGVDLYGGYLNRTDPRR